MSELVRLGDICRIQNGFAFDSARFTSSCGMPLIRIRDINNGDCSVFYDGAFDEAYVVRCGDILVGMDGEFNAAQWSGGPALLNQRVCRLIPDPEALDATYLLHRIKEDLKEIEVATASTTVKHISSKQIAALEWVLPPLNEQSSIAASLKAQLAEVDTARQAAQRQAQDIALLRARLLKEMLATLDGVPRKVLGEHAPTTSGTTPARGTKRYWEPAEIPWVKTGEVAFAPITRTEEAVSRAALAECSLSLLPPRTVLVAITGEGKTRGRSAVLEVSATTNQHSVAVMPNPTWDADFLQLWMESSYHDLRERSEGRGGSRSALSGAQIKALEVPTPDRVQQLAIVRRVKAALSEVDALAAANKKQREDVELLPQRLLAQAFEN